MLNAELLVAAEAEHPVADDDLRTALMLARGQQARSYELRAGLSLMRYERRLGVALNARRELVRIVEMRDASRTGTRRRTAVKVIGIGRVHIRVECVENG